MEQTEYVSGYFPKSIADKLKLTKDIAIQESTIEDFIKSSKDIFAQYLEELDVSLKDYRIMMQKTTIEIKKAREEMLNYENNLWEKFDIERKNLRSKIDELKAVLNPLKKELESINNILGSLSIFNAERLLKVINELSNACSSENANILKFLINNYKFKE